MTSSIPRPRATFRIAGALSPKGGRKRITFRFVIRRIAFCVRESSAMSWPRGSVIRFGWVNEWSPIAPTDASRRTSAGFLTAFWPMLKNVARTPYCFSSATSWAE